MNRSLILHRFVPQLYELYIRARAKQVEQAIAYEQLYYESRYCRNDISSLAEKISRRLLKRGLVIKPKSQGRLHMLYATGPSNWELHNIPPQLKLFGKLSCYFYRDHGFDDSSLNWLRFRQEMNSHLLAFVKEVHSREPIDIFLGYLSGWHVSPEVIRAISDMGIVTCGFNWDDKLSFRGRPSDGRWSGPSAVASAYDLNLTNAESSVVKYEVEGGLAMFWPEAANSQHFKPLDMGWKFDVSFVGACYGYRPILIEYLRKHGIRVETFGPGWPNGPISENEMVSVYASSRINLGFGGIGYSIKEQCLKGRDFEVPMCGAVYLTSNNPELKLVYKIGHEIEVYNDKQDCLEKIEFMLGNPQHASAMRQAARDKCLASHTWENRFDSMFRITGLLE